MVFLLYSTLIEYRKRMMKISEKIDYPDHIDCQLTDIQLSIFPYKYYPAGTVIHLYAHETIPQMKKMPIIIKEDAKVILACGQFININCSNSTVMVMVKVFNGDKNVVWNDHDYHRDRFVNLDHRVCFSVKNSTIKKIEM